MSSDDVVLKIDNVSKCFEMYGKPSHRLFQALTRGRKQFYKEFWAVKNVSLEVKRGECLGVIGRNGSGKSTLLQMIAGTLMPTEGSIEVKGRIAALLELGSGFNPEFTGRENVYMNASILGLRKDEIDEKYDAIVEFAEIGEFIDQPVKTYSSGMLLRLAFSVIAHVDADILIIDEALSVGDVFFVQKCMRFLRKFMETNTVLFVSHDTSAVMNLCDQAIWLRAGDVLLAGPPKEVVGEYIKDMYEAFQGKSDASSSEKNAEVSDPVDAAVEFKDARSEFINHSNLRNDIEVFEFDSSASSFGKKEAEITKVFLLDERGDPLSWVVGGEMVCLKIQCFSKKEMTSPIVGFSVRDRLGQCLFGDNTYLSYLDCPVHIGDGSCFHANFNFRMPILPAGDYSIGVALAEGTQTEHVQHHWYHDALALKSHASSVASGLVGVPMSDIKIEVVVKKEME